MSNQSEIVGIQYLRGIAACAVVLDHSSAMAAFDKYFGHELWGGFLEKGAMGVDLFFLISGFIIAIVSLERTTTAPAVAAGEFARRRAFRILPMMWLAVFSYAVLRTFVGGYSDPWSYVRAMLVWPVGDLEPNTVWTLRHEAIFYGLFALTFLGRRWLRPLLALWVASPFVYAAMGFAPDGSTLSALLRTITHPANIEFGTGLAIGLVWVRWLHAYTIKTPGLLVLSSIYFAVAIAIGNALDLRPDRVPDTLISAAIFAPLMLVAATAKCATNNLGLLLGNASFSVYLFHPHVVSGSLRIWSAIAPETPLTLVIPGVSLIAISIGAVLHLTAERPLQGLINAWWRRREDRTLRPHARSSA